MTLRFIAPLALVFASAGLMGCQKAAATPAARGQVLFAYCTPCHGPAGAGNHSLGAPAIAGMPQWYVKAQLEKFRSGVRGTHFDDAEGMRMRPMSMALANLKDVELVAGYVASMPGTKPAATITGADVAAGQASYATCMACHGDKGQGNEALKAPPLASSPDWYLLLQYQKFQNGVRGANPKDVSGGLMVPMSMLVKDEQAQKNLFAYIGTL